MDQPIQKSKFSDPEIEKFFAQLQDMCLGNNLRLKKAVVEIIHATQYRIACEMEDRQREIINHNEAIAELKSAHDSLNIPPQF